MEQPSRSGTEFNGWKSAASTVRVRGCLLLLALVHLSVAAAPGGGPRVSATSANVAWPFVTAEDERFLAELTGDVVEASRVEPGKRRGNSPTNSLGFTLICPGGNYPAYWIRDFAMSLDSGFITPKEMLQHLRLTAASQNGPSTRQLEHGLRIPPYAIPDHINFDGGAVFYPGTMSAGNDQGNGAFGILPPVDDHYEFVHIAWCLFRAAGSTNFLGEVINGRTVLERLSEAFAAPRVDSKTQLVQTEEQHRAVGFGFFDTVWMTGHMLFPSLLRYRAAGELAELNEALSLRQPAARLREIQQSIRRGLDATFEGTNGWLRASTGTSGQADVWGTLYALHLGVLTESAADRATHTIVDAVRQGTINYRGAVRHVPTDLDFSPSSAWERTAGVARNTYQNGAYWHTPTGWLIEVLRRRDEGLARQIWDEYIRALREDDYRRGARAQAPWETFGPNGYAQNGVYMTSVAVPLAILKAVPAHSGTARP